MKTLALSVALFTPMLAVADGGWEKLPDLPDPVGFGGMFAGVLDGILIVGGGSQFAERPLWQGGKKSYSDRVYVLSDPMGAWIESEVRMPKKLGHFAAAASENAIYLVGGISDEGVEDACLSLVGTAHAMEIRRLPALPRPVVYGVAAVVRDRLVVACGQSSATDKNASREVWSLDITKSELGWRREADLPGPGVIVAAAGAFEDGFYLFGGLAYDGDGRPVPSAKAYRYDMSLARWEHLAELSEPRVGAASPCPVLADGRFLIAGGYASVFPGTARAHPGFSRQTLLYDPRSDLWEDGPLYPMDSVKELDAVSDRTPRPPAAAAGVNWLGRAIIVGGETRPSVRTPVVLSWSP